MNDRIPQGLVGTGRVPLVNLIISFDTHECYLVQRGPAGPSCPRVALAAGPGGIDQLGPGIESATKSALGLVVTYIGVLSFEVTSTAIDMYVLVSARQPVSWPLGTTLMTLPELVRAGADIAMISLFQAAAGRAEAERFALTIGSRVQHALARSVEYLEERFTVEDSRAGWSQYLSNDAVGVLSSAQGLLALAHACAKSRYIEPVARCLEQAQNQDGGWQVKHSLRGEPTQISITESTCYCLWALVESGRTEECIAVSSGAAWLMNTQRPSGGWGVSERSAEAQVIATAFAVRMLARLGNRGAVGRGVQWLRDNQREDGSWPLDRAVVSPTEPDLSPPAPTAHAVIALLSAGVPANDNAIIQGVAYLRRRFNSAGVEPWRSALSDTLVDPRTDSRLIFRHYTTPWALVALSQAGASLSDPLVQRGILQLLAQQMPSGAWRCNATVPASPTMWAAHDTVFALKTVVSIGVRILQSAPVLGLTTASLESMMMSFLLTNGSPWPGAQEAMGA